MEIGARNSISEATGTKTNDINKPFNGATLTMEHHLQHQHFLHEHDDGNDDDGDDDDNDDDGDDDDDDDDDGDDDDYDKDDVLLRSHFSCARVARRCCVHSCRRLQTRQRLSSMLTSPER